jgi:LPS sulfotransferase NodH
MPAAPTRFIILGHGRTGSNLLGSSLNLHPRVAVSDELFHDSEEKRSAWAGTGRYWRDGEDPIPFLEETVYSPRPDARILAAGFRIFYYHVKDDRRVWEYLAADESVRIVHLSRRNLFECFVSRCVALKTGEWKRTAKDAPAALLEPFEIDVDTCRTYFDSITAYREWARSYFAAHPRHDLYYEDLVADFQSNVDGVFRFLDVEPVATRMVYEKQARIPVCEQVSNYAILRGVFGSTPYEGFFE